MKEFELLTTAEVSQSLKIAPKTVRRWYQQRKLNGIMLGNKLRFRQSAIDLFLAQRETKAVNP